MRARAARCAHAARPIRLLLASVALFCAPAAAPQMVPFSNFCQTRFGICPTAPAPVNTPCFCTGPNVRHEGRIVFPPQNWNNVCGTWFGVCYSPPGPIGAPCLCGNLQGQIIGR